MQTYKLIAYLFLVIGIFGCGINDSSPSHPETAELSRFSYNKQIIYFNSFESDADTLDFFGLHPEMFVENPSPGGGMKSLLIGGGCIQPAGSLTIKIKDEGRYNISFLSKTGDTGGIVEVRVNFDSYSYSQFVSIDNKTWDKRQFNDVYCPQGSMLTIDLLVGGIVYASANIDEMKVELRNCINAEKVRSENLLRN